MKPYKKPKYKLDIGKVSEIQERKEKKESDWTVEEFYREQLRSKGRLGRR